MFQINVEIKHILYSINFFENYAIYEMWKNVERGRSHDNMTHVHCMLDSEGYKRIHTQGI